MVRQMRKRILNVAAAIYIACSLVVACTAITDRQAAVASHQDEWADVVAPVGGHVTLTGVVRGEDTKLVVWSIKGCGGCITFKRNQVPKLEAAGLAVEVRDADTTPPEDDTITSYPTIILYDGDEELGRWVGDTKAEEILAFVPEDKEPELPPDYRIWDNIKRWLNL